MNSTLTFPTTAQNCQKIFATLLFPAPSLHSI